MTTGSRDRAGCVTPQHHQFDFWLGEWEVFDPDGRLVGHNRITRAVRGCGLREQWRGRRGLLGTSLNSWSQERGQWHQTWIDSAGTLLLLDGGMRDGAMVLEGTAADEQSRALRHRISWSVMDGNPDRVRQLWQTATDEGDWETAFDGRYHRAGT